jgi:hypothetical protein
MNTRTKKAIASFVKYVIWTLVAAIAVGATNALTGVDLPASAVPVVGAVLKGIATYAASEAIEYMPK